MPPISLAHVIQLPNRRRLVLERLDPDFMLYFHSYTIKENNTEAVEYWKCVHRVCSIRICSRGSVFKFLPEHGKHNHRPYDSAFSFLQKNHYVIEKVIFLNKMQSAAMSTCAPSSQLSESDCHGNGSAVLKQLLMSGKDDIRRDSIKSSSIPLLTNRMSTSRQPSSEQGFSPFHPKQIPAISLPTESTVQYDGLHHLQHRSITSQQLWEATGQQTERWSPPVLTPPPPGRLYSSPSTPVARIEPYVEPQVMYNPFFLWQLYSYKQSCINSNYSHLLSLRPRTC